MAGKGGGGRVGGRAGILSFAKWNPDGQKDRVACYGIIYRVSAQLSIITHTHIHKNWRSNLFDCSVSVLIRAMKHLV